MNTYETYLKTKNYAPSTIQSYQKQVAFFVQWCQLHQQQPSTIDYKNCLLYLKYLSQKNISKRTINFILGCIKSYFNYLIKIEVREDNPLTKTIVKGVVRTLNHNLLDPEILEALYHEATASTPKEKRNKMVVGLMVYQGLNTSDIKLLKTDDINLHKGTIHIPKRKKSNSRILELKPWQIMEFMEYLNQVRPSFLNELQQRHNEQLIVYGKQFGLTHYVVMKLKKQHPKLENTPQIRASVITNWLKEYNLREVQYMAGHRYISSTERYLQEDLENLQNIINQCHPIS